MKSVLIFILSCIYYLPSIPLKADNNFLKISIEDIIPKTSILLLQNKVDSILDVKFKKIKKLYDTKKYVEGLKLVLEFNDSIKKQIINGLNTIQPF
tara:strand:- start:358 stop:645 length:288 start_codon:yes stop_codon:yes gene_type:complete